jgi:hypothetical protein
LTTFQIVMAAIRQVADDRDEQRARKHVEPLLLIDPDLVDDPELRYKLIPTNADRLAFRSIVTDGPRTEPKLPEGASDRTIDAFRFFVDQIGPWLDEGDDTPTNKLIALAKAVRNLVKIVVIDLEARDNAQAIFETLNARGQPLLAADLIKNDLFQRATVQKESAGHLYETYWHDFDMKHWREEVGQGRFRRPRIDIFLGYWLTMRTLDEVPTQQLFDRFRDHMRTAGMVGPVEPVLKDLRTNAETFEGFDKLVVGTPEQLFFYRLSVMEANTAFPVMLYLFGPDGIKDEADRRRAIAAIESWLVRRMLRRMTTKNYNQVFLGLLKRLGSSAPPSSAVVINYLTGLDGDSRVWPDDDSLRADLVTVPYYTSITRARLRMILEALEVSLHGPLTGPFTPWKALTIEHVLPQEWRANWPLPPGADPHLAAIERDAARHRLGNLTLVTQELNSSLSNAPWTTAVGHDSKREALNRSNTLMLNKPILAHDAWDEAAIGQRSLELAERILGIWPGPGGEGPGAAAAPDLKALAARFHDHLVEVYVRVKQETGYNATYFMQMIDELGGVATAKQLISSAHPSSGYSALWERKRLDFTVEAIALLPEWRPLFTDTELTAARERLEQYGFDLDAYLEKASPVPA